MLSWSHVIENSYMLMFICRTKDRSNHLFIHLNLSIALTLGLVVFLAGIENATKYRVSYDMHTIYVFVSEKFEILKGRQVNYSQKCMTKAIQL